VVDLNRPPDGASLYPGQSVTGLCPVDTFDDTPVYASKDDLPDDAEVAERRDAIWHPYHRQLQAELDRLKAAHGTIALWDAHSIRSVLPRFFDGKLPDLNLGTDEGRACAPRVQAAVEAVLAGQRGYTQVSNGRFKGGYITRHYGEPARGVHALQMEMCHGTYMDEPAPFGFRPDLAAGVRPLLQRMLQAALDTAVEAGA
jgi:N-formylglutamate deformylase